MLLNKRKTTPRKSFAPQLSTSKNEEHVPNDKAEQPPRLDVEPPLKKEKLEKDDDVNQDDSSSSPSFVLTSDSEVQDSDSESESEMESESEPAFSGLTYEQLREQQILRNQNYLKTLCKPHKHPSKSILSKF